MTMFFFEVDFDKMSVSDKDRDEGCEWYIEEVEIPE